MDRRNNQQIHIVTAFCHQQVQRTVMIMVIMIIAPIIIERNFHSGALSAGKKMIFADF